MVREQRLIYCRMLALTVVDERKLAISERVAIPHVTIDTRMVSSRDSQRTV